MHALKYKNPVKQDVQLVNVPEQVRQLLEHVQTPVELSITDPVGQELTH